MFNSSFGSNNQKSIKIFCINFGLMTEDEAANVENISDALPSHICVFSMKREQSWEMNLLLGKHFISKSNSRSQDLHKAAVGTILLYSKPN